MTQAIKNAKGARMTRAIAAVRARHALPERACATGAAPASDEADSDIDGRECIRLCFLIYDVARLHRCAYDEFMKPLGVNRVQWSMLAQLSRHDGVLQSQLANLLELNRAYTGEIVASLEASGWIERRDDPYVKRVKRVYLVRPAHRVIEQMSGLAGQFGDRIFGSLSNADRKSLSQMLSTVKRDLMTEF